MRQRIRRTIRYGLVILLVVKLSWFPAAVPAQTVQVAEANRLNRQAIQLQQAGRYVEAVPLVQEALAIDEKELGPDHPMIATLLTNLAFLYSALGDNSRAAPLLHRALAIDEKTLGPDNSLVGIVLANLGGLYEDQGDFARAGPFFERSLAIAEKASGPEHPDVAAALGNLAGLYVNRGEHERAAPLYQRALAINEKVYGRAHREVARMSIGLASVFHDQGDYSRAAPLYERALVIYERTLGPNHPDVAMLRSNLGGLYEDQGDHARSTAMLQSALAIGENALGPDHPDVAILVNNLALRYQTQGDYPRAAELLQRALSIYEKARGPNHPVVGTVLNNLAWLYSAQGKYERALPFLQRATDVEERNLTQIFNSGSQQQKALYLNSLSEQTYRKISMHLNAVPRNADAARLAMTVILQRKGRELDASSDQIAVLRRRASPEDQKLLDQLFATQSRISTLELSKTIALSAESRRAEVNRLSTEQERLEDSISRRSAEFRTLARSITFESVRQAIPVDASLVELYVYRPYQPRGAKPNTDWFGSPRYVAYVLRRVDNVPQYVDLGETAVIDADAAKFRAVLRTARTPEAEIRERARSLDERVMRPIRKLMGATRRVFLSPDGALNLVPFDAFVDEHGHYLIENYSFNYLTSGRDLVRLQVTAATIDAPTIVADPLFSIPREMADSVTRPRRIDIPGPDANPNIAARSIDFAQIDYAPLEGTAEEAKAISSLITRVRVWTQGNATEAALKTVNRPSILHIATHGFFLQDQPPAAPDVGRLLVQLDTGRRSPQQENPMLRSGLILAGVNQSRSGAGEDGVLTAQETAGLNLFGTKLVVLSACETGLGDVQNGAGVYGLRRALVLAGSETQIMSLWQVSDLATRDLMIAYYAHLQQGAGRIAALREAQLAMLRGTNAPKNGEGKADWRNPYFWAAFIPSGAWTALDGKEPE